MTPNSLPIFTDWNDALDGVVHALGGYKAIGVTLRPELETKPESASQWLRDCLNPEKRERLNPDQVFMLLRLARAQNYHAAKHWLDAELQYEQSKPINPTDEALNLQQRGAELVRELRVVCDRFERLNQVPPGKR